MVDNTGCETYGPVRASRARRLGLKAVLIAAGMLALSQTIVLAQSTDTTAGQTEYGQTCVACHQDTGQGIPGTFPPLAGTVPLFLQKGDKGRRTLEDIVVFGMTGAVTIDGTDYNGTMVTWGKVLDDQQISDVLNYVAQAWGNDKQLHKDFKPFTPAEIKQVRGDDLTPAQTLELRNKLGL